MNPNSPENQEGQSIQTPPAKDVALQLHEKIPGIRVVSLGTNIPPEYRTFGEVDDVLEHGEVLQITGEQGHHIRILVSKAYGFPGERVDILPDSIVDAETQVFAVSVNAALSFENP